MRRNIRVHPELCSSSAFGHAISVSRPSIRLDIRLVFVAYLPRPDHMDSSPEIAKIESQIQALTDLSTRLQQLRNVPAWLYKSPNSMMPMEPIREQFENLKQLGNNLTSETVQEALKAARESEEKDKSELTLKYRTDTNRAKYVISSSRDQPIQPRRLGCEHHPLIHRDTMSRP